jgi:hypothetical protein
MLPLYVRFNQKYKSTHKPFLETFTHTSYHIIRLLIVLSCCVCAIGIERPLNKQKAGPHILLSLSHSPHESHLNQFTLSLL